MILFHLVLILVENWRRWLKTNKLQKDTFKFRVAYNCISFDDFLSKGKIS